MVMAAQGVFAHPLRCTFLPAFQVQCLSQRTDLILILVFCSLLCDFEQLLAYSGLPLSRLYNEQACRALVLVIFFFTLCV